MRTAGSSKTRDLFKRLALRVLASLLDTYSYIDRTIRTYRLPDFTPEHVLTRHRAAVNAVSVSGQYIASASGDRSMGIWDAETGQLLQMFDNHHGRGYALNCIIVHPWRTCSFFVGPLDLPLLTSATLTCCQGHPTGIYGSSMS